MRAIYAFSGDPITLGHIDIVERASKTYDEVLVAIGENPKKTNRYLFSGEQRLAMASKCLARFKNVRCVTFTGLLAEYAYRNGFDVIVRGVRNASDLEGELVLFQVNNSLHPRIDTVFFPTRPHLSHISSGTVKAIVREGGDVSAYCPLMIKEELEGALLGRFSIGIAGGIAVGKTHVATQLVAALKEKYPAHYVSLDAVGHYVLGSSEETIYRETRSLIAKQFGDDVLNPDGSVDRRKLGHIVFADGTALNELNELMREPMLTRLYDELRQLGAGIIVLEGAILIEANWSRLVNNNVVLVDAPRGVRGKRLMARDQITKAEAEQKIRRQLSNDDRRLLMEEQIRQRGWGRLWPITNVDNKVDLAPLVDEITALANAHCQ